MALGPFNLFHGLQRGVTTIFGRATKGSHNGKVLPAHRECLSPKIINFERPHTCEDYDAKLAFIHR